MITDLISQVVNSMFTDNVFTWIHLWNSLLAGLLAGFALLTVLLSMKVAAACLSHTNEKGRHTADKINQFIERICK